MIRRGFLGEDGREELRALARARRGAGAAPQCDVPLNDGWGRGEVAAAPLMDDDTGSRLAQTYEEHGPAGLVVFGHGGGDSHLSARKRNWNGFEPKRRAARGHDRRVDQSDACVEYSL
jgi:hypothetical protein